MLPSAGWGAVRHRPRQKIGAKLNQSILEMALVSRCQGERLQERDQAGAGRRGPGGRHHCRGTAGCLLTPTCVGYGGSSCWLSRGAEQDGIFIHPAGKAEPGVDCMPQFPTLWGSSTLCHTLWAAPHQVKAWRVEDSPAQCPREPQGCAQGRVCQAGKDDSTPGRQRHRHLTQI